MDVVRYGDSNGSDENHAYPHAFRYRNYVIRSFNAGVPFDQFAREQVAGDLLKSVPGGGNVTTATGFLAIGTKILAERDPVKKRADMIDEQLDTFGRAFFGLTIGCARCHDHKFDPIATRDYYALAGIFHSSEVGDAKVERPDYLQAKAAFEEGIKKQTSRLALLNEKLQVALSKGKAVVREAESFACFSYARRIDKAVACRTNSPP